MLTKVFGSAVFGVEATTITVEVNVDKASNITIRVMDIAEEQ